MSRKTGFNGLTPREWALMSKSVWNDVSSPRKRYHLEHGATFPLALAERVIRIYSAHGDLILDPFVGTGTTLLAAKRNERYGIGMELYRKFVDVAVQVCSRGMLMSDLPPKNTLLTSYNKRVIYNDGYVTIIWDDCRKLLQYIPRNSIQLVLTSPPYARLLHKVTRDRKKVHKSSVFVTENHSTARPYGNNPLDFGNLEYDEYLEEIKSLMSKIYTVMKHGGYNVWVVKDYRDPQRGRPFVPLHVDIANAGRDAGFVWHDLIVWDQNAQRKLVVLGYPSVFYVNINHTFLVVMRKP